MIAKFEKDPYTWHAITVHQARLYGKAVEQYEAEVVDVDPEKQLTPGDILEAKP